jgi:hypothetical protein
MPQVAEPPAEPTTVKPRGRPFTREQGRELRRRQAEAGINPRWVNRKKAEMENQPHAPQPEPGQTKAEAPRPHDEHGIERVREHIDSVNAALERELSERVVCEHCGQVAGPDALVVERLCKSLDLLSERLRVLEGKPLPGSLRPEGPRRRGIWGGGAK